MDKILILPEKYDIVHTWWPYWVVSNLFKNDYKKRFKFIEKKWIIERSSTLSNWFFKKNLRKIWLIYIIFFLKKLLHIYIHYIYNKKKGNTIICHDTFFAFNFIFFKKVSNITFVYHGQWPSYNEIINIWWAGKSYFLRKFLEFFESYIFKKSTFIWFPSFWAYEAFINNTNPYIKKILKNALNEWRIKILYNWINLEQSYKMNDAFEKKENELLFTTVSTLNYEKWVDRIPDLIAKLKKWGINLKWILVWNWKYISEIKNKISKLWLESNVEIYQTPFSKEEIIWLFKKSDFYVMLHRISIFDYATLEAMNEGNIPILSNIGWNKEVIKDKNGFLVNENDIIEKEFSEIINFIKNSDIIELKKKNIEVIKNYFTEKNFIDWYYSLYE